MEELERYEVMDPQTALVAQGASIVRLENNTQMQIAIQHPRDEGRILGLGQLALPAAVITWVLMLFLV